MVKLKQVTGLSLFTSDPRALYELIVHKINNGELHTWTVDRDGHFTHSPQQWSHGQKRLWLSPHAHPGELRLKVIRQQGAPYDPEITGVYIGRFITAVIGHFALQVAGVSWITKDVVLTPQSPWPTVSR